MESENTGRPEQIEAPPSIIVARGLIFFTVAAFMLIGPFYRQVLGGRAKIFRPWTMFSGAEADICDVKFVSITDKGEEVIDRFKVLGYDRPGEAPRSLRFIRSEKKAYRIGSKLCKKLGPNADIRLYGRKGALSQGSWKWFAKGEQNLCQEQPD